MKLTNEDVQDILQLVNVSSFNVLNLQTDRFKLSLRRTGDGEWTQSAQELSATNLMTPAAVRTETAAPVAAPKAAPAAEDGLVDIRTPLLGTFYRSPKPGSPPFVEIGSRVDKDTVVAIVETMKLMNSVYAGVCGTIAEICLGDADFADHEAVLMRVKPEGV
ncbi:acetyl-CoA carboxylase biotin carboxyl carrier protein [Geobacter argillaceus]|uniref:Biotin carboxyl carrier protein of acetyl-CoA carboxylase n=1 Tax=Geobacter argillaceus TaxID=345631 RepID=A0A562V670_9BACT|nr:biotin/lipoyl-containing protein [Geobacter argillaceus]TWJ13292.1 biotin carboxyl carrier protein [Geobacter argillaceus]